MPKKLNEQDLQDLVGKKFNKLTPIRFDHIDNTSKRYRKYIYECLCDCGNTTFVSRTNLKTGIIRSCGCAIFDAATRKMLKSNHTGERYGNITITSFNPEYSEKMKTPGKNNRHCGGYWNAICDCGRELVVNHSILIALRKRIDEGTFVGFACGNEECEFAKTVKEKRIRTMQNKARERGGSLVGKRFGWLVVTGLNEEKSEDSRINGNHQSYWNCICDCGRTHVVSRSSLLSGHTKTCGHHGGPSSQWEVRICELLQSLMPNRQFKYKNNGKQLFLYNNKKKRLYYDCVIDDKFIIEMNGTTYHPKSPNQLNKLGEEWTTPYGKTAKMVFENDEMKKHLAVESGYHVIVVWSDMEDNEIAKYVMSEIEKIEKGEMI